MGTQATFRHVTSDLHYSVGRLLRLSKADFDVQRKDDWSSLNNDCKEAGYEPMRISFNHRQFCTIFSVHLVFLISGPLVGCPVAACALGKRGSQNMGLFPVCCPSDASERSAHYIRWVFVAQVAMWLLMAPTLTCAVLREVLEGSSHFSCQVPSTIELLLWRTQSSMVAFGDPGSRVNMFLLLQHRRPSHCRQRHLKAASFSPGMQREARELARWQRTASLC